MIKPPIGSLALGLIIEEFIIAFSFTDADFVISENEKERRVIAEITKPKSILVFIALKNLLKSYFLVVPSSKPPPPEEVSVIEGFTSSSVQETNARLLIIERRMM